MKNERRHELQTNILADWTGGVVERIKPYIKTIGIACLAITVVAVGLGVMNWRSGRKAGASWQSFMSAARNADEQGFEETVAVYKAQGAGPWAQLAKANMELSAAAGEMARDPRGAADQLESVVTSYQEISETAKEGSMIRERAQFGLAVANEYLAAVSPKRHRNYVEAAKNIYIVLKSDASKSISKAASDNLALLDKYAPSENRLIRLMKTAAAILEKANAPAIERVAQELCDKFADIRSELEDDAPEDDDSKTWLAWLAHENYNAPLNPNKLPEGLFPQNPGGLGPGGLGPGGLGPGGLGPGGLGPGGLGPGGLGPGGLGGSGLGGSDMTKKSSAGEGLLKSVGEGLGTDDVEKKFPIDLNKKDDGTKKDGTKKDGTAKKKDATAKKKDATAKKKDAFPLNKKGATKGPAKKGDAFPLDKKGAANGPAKTPLTAPANNKAGEAAKKAGETVKKAAETGKKAVSPEKKQPEKKK